MKIVKTFRNSVRQVTKTTSALDALGRVTAKNLPGSEPDVTFAYDLFGRTTSAAQTGNSLSFTYDALGRNLTQVGPHGTVTSTWDIAGRRTRIAHPDGFYVDQDYLVTGEPNAIRENGATSGAGVLATYAWDDLGRRSSLARGDGSVLSYSYDAVSRLTQLADNLVGTAYDQTLGFGYTPASQIASNTRSNDAYAWTGHYNLNRGYTANGRNQYTATGSITPTYDSKGNLTSAGATTYTYTSENLLTSASGGIALAYDPAMRLYQMSGGSAGTARFAYDGSALIAEYNSSNAMLRRYVHGPGVDEPLVWYEGSGTSDRRFLHPDERGSVVAVTNSSGTTLNVNGYNEYGIPSSGNVGRFQYTGQTWLPELGMYYYKARIYSPTLGRFLQTDPIGYGDGMNMYGYVGGDPVNSSDPTGTDMENALSSNRAYPIDNDDEWYVGKGPNLIAMAGGHSRDGMGMSDLVRMAGGRHETAAFERFNDAAARLNQISNLTGFRTGCLLSAICTSDAVYLVSGDQFKGGGGGSFAGAGASGSGWGPAFDGLKDHWARHGEELGTRSPDQYYNQAERNIARGSDFRFRIDDQQRLAHITRIGRDAFMFTSTNLAETRIYTHMRLNQRSLSNIGITLPRGF